MRGFFVFLLYILCTHSVQANNATWAFTWYGAGGYEMRGAMSYATPDGDLVREDDVSCFVIEGFKDGESIGQWALTDLTLDTTWRLHFDPVAGAFVPEFQGINMPQAWNMNGIGNNCGPGGFGFNLGSFAQDICVDGTLITASQLPPETPFPAVRNDAFQFPLGACNGPELLSYLGDVSDR